ncbi:hypothetical protein Patl1_24674 [Pistacia atlantica]|uniref:Uncharacterized protein n=2 Tax=Pistacia TaxID=55512 RepID=A0ACC1A097_9ROSI|nr:hypothetical protein Patl1_24674 [Pistacia atlantica]
MKNSCFDSVALHMEVFRWQEHWCCSSPLISASHCKNSPTSKQRYLSFFTKSAKIVVVIFNNGVHEIRDIFWDGIPLRGASWLREEPIESIWTRVILVPACGGFFVSLINALQAALDEENISNMNFYDYLKAALQPLLKATAACFTLGTGNSLGPEGPSVEIGKSIAKGVGNLFYKSPQRSLSLVAAGAAAGISSDKGSFRFHISTSFCHSLKSALWPSPATDTDSYTSLPNTTSMVILSAVIASVVSEVGLGSEPAFKVPDYDFRSPGELPLYLLLGILCGLISLTLSRCTTYMLVIVNDLHKVLGIPKAVFPIMGGVTVGLIALVYPEILYWGFENVDILLESRPFVNGLSTNLLLQLGMAYGKFINFAIAQSNPAIDLSILEVASPQAYGLVGMAATLAGVCQVPLTSMRRREVKETKKAGQEKAHTNQQSEIYLPVGQVDLEIEELGKRIFVSEAMRTRYVTVLMTTSLTEVVTLMLAEKQSCAMIVDNDNILLGLLTLGDIQDFSKYAIAKKRISSSFFTHVVHLILLAWLMLLQELLVSEICFDGEKCRVPWTATPSMDLLSVLMTMNRHGISQVPVVLEHIEDHRGHLVGLLDRECISLTCRALATRKSLS